MSTSILVALAIGLINTVRGFSSASAQTSSTVLILSTVLASSDATWLSV